MLAIFPIFLLVGLFAPGFFLAKCLGHRLWWASAIIISLLILFHSVFWLGVSHVPIRLWTVLPILVAATAAAAWLRRKFATSPTKSTAPSWTAAERILLVSSGLVGAVLLVHSAIAPLLGGDMLFRWDFLAQRLFALGRFDFYPPLTPADFRAYFFVDGIPPLISFSYWWLYVSAGQYLPALICIFVGAQFACTLAFTYGTASAVFSHRAGVFAAAILAASPFYFRSIVLGQETGMTALAIAAMLYFIVTARQENDTRAMVSAGMAAALCALSREYGWIALIAGVIALLWRRTPLKQVILFGAVAAAAAGPWYARNWMLASNPFYSLRFANFAVNPIHDRILHYYNSALGVQRFTSESWWHVLFLFLLFATFQVLAGIPGGFVRFRQNGYLLVIALLLTAVWVQSIGYTSGGLEGSMRVLSPALVVLSITAAGILEPLTRRMRLYKTVVAAVLVCQIWTAVQGAVYPDNPLSLGPDRWLANAFPRVPPAAEFQIRDELVRLLPKGYRVLSDSAYLHAALIDSGIEVVPVWSPEVQFLFSTPPAEADRRLRDLHIGSVVCYPQTLNMSFLASASPFYASLPERWTPLGQAGDFLFIFGP